MHILIYGINYAPELTGIGKYTGEISCWLAKRGHKVEVITALPYYPQWNVYDSYRGRLWHVEAMEGVKVRRTPLYVPQRVTGKTRIIHEMSFGLGSLYHWLPAFGRKFDVLIGVCPPLQMGLLPYMYKALRGKPFVFHIQDLQVDAAKNLGLIKNPYLLSVLYKVERHLLRNASIVSTISEGMVKKIVNKGINGERTFLLPNWADTNFIRPLPRENLLRKELGFSPEDKVILYAGNMGEKQGLEVVIEAAQRLKYRQDVVFAFVGEGAAKKRIQAMAGAAGLDKVKFFSLQPYARLPELFSLADLHLVTQKRAASDLVMPSKLTGILAAGGASIVTAEKDTTLYDTIEKAGMGILVEPECSEALYMALSQAIDNNLEEIRVNARRYAEENLGRDNVLERFEHLLHRLIDGKNPEG